MSMLDFRALANQRNFSRAQEAWDRMTPQEYEDDAREELATEAAEAEVLCNGGMIADALSTAMSTRHPSQDYAAVNVESLCRPEFAADDKSLAVLLAVMASGDPESARRALLSWRLKLPALLASDINERAAELLREAPECEL